MTDAPAGDVLLTEVADGIGVVTLNRPHARNALNSALIRALRRGMAAMEADVAVDVVVLTGADPAFCAGLDLREMGSSGANVSGGGGDLATAGSHRDRPWPPMTKPVIGAVNGPAVTGGLELALNCDFLVASERARFGDTHARVGALPGWGAAVLLAQAVGVRKAVELSLTGRFLDATDAHAWGLVAEVVPHDELLPAARGLAAEMRANDRVAVRALLDEYKQVSATTVTEGRHLAAELFAAWRAEAFDPAHVAERRAAIIEQGRRASQ